jgi:hypothetical protein
MLCLRCWMAGWVVVVGGGKGNERRKPGRRRGSVGRARSLSFLSVSAGGNFLKDMHEWQIYRLQRLGFCRAYRDERNDKVFKAFCDRLSSSKPPSHQLNVSPTHALTPSPTHSISSRPHQRPWTTSLSPGAALATRPPSPKATTPSPCTTVKPTTRQRRLDWRASTGAKERLSILSKWPSRRHCVGNEGEEGVGRWPGPNGGSVNGSGRVVGKYVARRRERS